MRAFLKRAFIILVVVVLLLLLSRGCYSCSVVVVVVNVVRKKCENLCVTNFVAPWNNIQRFD